MTAYAWSLLCTLVEEGPIWNYEVWNYLYPDMDVVAELWNLGLALPRNVPLLPPTLEVTPLGRLEYKIIN